MRILLLVTAVIEAAAGLAMATCPSAAVQLMLGSALDGTAAVALGRLTGVALLALGLASWSASRDVQSRAAAGVVTAMLLYNGAVSVLFLYLRLGEGLTSIGLWPVVVLHAAMAVWCISCLRSTASPSRDNVG